MGWQWHKLGHNANHFSQVDWHLTNSVRALKAIECSSVGSLTPASSFKHVDISQQTVAIDPQRFARRKWNQQSTVKYVHVCAVHCACHRTIQHRRVSIIFPLILQSSLLRCCLLEGMVDYCHWNTIIWEWEHCGYGVDWSQICGDGNDFLYFTTPRNKISELDW